MLYLFMSVYVVTPFNFIVSQRGVYRIICVLPLYLPVRLIPLLSFCLSGFDIFIIKYILRVEHCRIIDYNIHKGCDKMTLSILSNGFEKTLLCQNEHEPPYTKIKQQLLQFLSTMYFKGYTCFCVNCEYGIPLWTAEIICALKKYNDVKLFLVIPYEEQCLNWQEDLRSRYYKVHELADNITFAEKHYTEGCYKTAENIMRNKSDNTIVFSAHDFICQ